MTTIIYKKFIFIFVKMNCKSYFYWIANNVIRIFIEL